MEVKNYQFRISKDSLLSLVNSIITWKKFTNFGEDWSSGKPFGALINDFLPGACSEWRKWDNGVVKNELEEAIEEVKKRTHLQVSIDSENVFNSDEKSIYQFIHELIQMFPIFAFGPGLRTRVLIGQNISFSVFTAHLFKESIQISIQSPNKEEEEYTKVSESIDENKNILTVYSYCPMLEGDYRITLKMVNEHIAKSPYLITVDNTGSDLDNVAASGPGLECIGNKVNRKTYFHIFTAALAEKEYGIEAGTGIVDCVILDPRGRRNGVKPKINHQGEDKYIVEYTPLEEGLHSVNVFFAGHQIPQSPFGVTISPDYDAKQAYASGRGVQQEGIRVGDNVDFLVNAKDGGDGQISVLIKNPNNDIHSCQILPEKNSIYRVLYTPDMMGIYKIEVKLRDDHILLSPFQVHVKKFSDINVRVYGPGILYGIVNHECFFIVETNDENGSLGFAIRGPSETKINCIDNNDGSASISYVPSAPGEYAIHVLLDEENIPKSPFMVTVETGLYKPPNVSVEFDNSDAEVNDMRTVNMNFQTAVHDSDFKVECFNKEGIMVPINIKQIDEQKKKYSCSFVCSKPGKHRILLSYHGVNLHESPMEIIVREPSKPENVKIYGPCLEMALRNKETYFIVDCLEAGPGDIELSILDERGCDVSFTSQERDDGKIEIIFTPLTAGPNYTINAYFAGHPIVQSPIILNIKSDIDFSKARVEEMRTHVYKESFESFLINIKEVSYHDQIKVFSKIIAPDNKVIAMLISKKENGIYQCKYSAMMTGTYQIEIYGNDIPIFPKPFQVHVTSGYDPSRVKFSGDGLKDGCLEDCKEFLLNLEGAGEGGLNVNIDGPTKTAISCTDNENGTCLVKYYPKEEGIYKISVKFHDINIKGSPFSIKIKDKVPGQNITCSGPGLGPQIQIDTWSNFIINTSKEIDNLPIKVEIIGLESKQTKETKVTERDNEYEVKYISKFMEKIEIKVKFGEYDIKNSPFYVDVLPNFEIDKIVAFGNGIQPLFGFLPISDKKVSFSVDTTKAGEPNINVNIKDSMNNNVLVEIILKDKVYLCSYPVKILGDYKISILCNGEHIHESPFIVNAIMDADILSHDLLKESEGKCNIVLKNCSNLDEENQIIGSTFVKDNESILPEIINKETFSTLQNSFDNDNHLLDNLIIQENCINMNSMDSDHSERKVSEIIPIIKINSNSSDSIKDSPFILNNPAFNNSNDKGPYSFEKRDLEIISPEVIPKINEKSENNIFKEFIFEEEDIKKIETVENIIKLKNLEHASTEIIPILNLKTTNNDISKDLQIDVNNSLIENKNNGNHIFFNSDIKDIKKQSFENIPKITLTPTQHELDVTFSNYSDSTHSEMDDMQKLTWSNERNEDSEIEIENFLKHEENKDLFVVDEIIENKINQYKLESGHNEPFIILEPYSFQENNFRLNEANTMNGNSSIEKMIPEAKQSELSSSHFFVEEDVYAKNEYIEPQVEQRMSVYKLVEQLKDDTNKENMKGLSDFNILPMVHLKYLIEPNCEKIEAAINCQDCTSIEADTEINRDYPYVHIYFQPICVGDYILHIVCDGEPLHRSPYLINVNTECIPSQITAMGLGLQSSIINTWSKFTIVSKNTTSDDFSVTIYGPNVCYIFSQHIDDGSHNISYMTSQEGNYNICIKYLDTEIIGSPFLMKASRPKIEFSYLKLETMTEIPIKLDHSYLERLYISVQTPSGEKDIWNCAITPNGYLGMLVRPKIEGKYYLFPCVGNKKISQKPYSLIIDTHHLPHPEYTKVITKINEQYFVRENISFIIDTSKAGYGNLNIMIEGPEKIEIKNENNEPGQSLLNCVVNIPGLYIISIFFAAQMINSFPKILKIVDNKNMLFNSKINFEIIEVQKIEIQRNGQIAWPFPGDWSNMNVQAKIKAPSGSVQYCDIIDFDNNHFNIQFKPQEVGEYNVSVKNEGKHVPGSPFKFYVENLEDSGSQNVRVFGMGLHSGYTNEINEFSINSSDAGQGNIYVNIDGPSKAIIEIKDMGDGNNIVRYQIPERGQYMCSITFNDEHIHGSPFKMIIEDSNRNSISENVTLASMQNNGLMVGNTSAFTIKHHGLSNGLMKAFVITPSMKEETVKINHLEDDHFNVEFEPTQTGLHYIHILLNERPISGSPFEVMVGEVIAHGDGLIEGKIGEENCFKLDTKFAEPGPLTVTIDGPSKVELDCFETDQGYEFSYMPTIAGEYIIAVKYGNNVHAKGSPFKVNVLKESHKIQPLQKSQLLKSPSSELKSYPENVKCRGDGLVKAFFGRNNQFVVDASSGGAGVLYVGITGPAKPCEEVTVRHIGGKRFQVNYFLQEFGEHTITLRWGEKEIPGSPHTIFVQ